jgi:hypothetical protein
MKEYRIVTDIPEVTFPVMGVSEDEAREVADQLLGTCEITKIEEIE